MNIRHGFTLCFISISLLIIGGAIQQVIAQEDNTLSTNEALGRALFFDENLSIERNQSCATCHAPEVGFTGPDSEVNATTVVYPGSIHTRFGNRKPPTAAYAGFSPVLYYDETDEVWEGGMFWDGRASGDILGDPLAEQAQGPFLAGPEQALLDPQHLCIRVTEGDYTNLFTEVWGDDFLNCDTNVDAVYVAIAEAIAAYERSSEVSPFSSKYDYYLAGEAELTELELRGLELFNGDALCSECHLNDADDADLPPLFTDFTYDNLGVPANPNNPFYADLAANPAGEDWVDLGLGEFLQKSDYPADVYLMEMGKYKVPTLRNVDLRPSEDFVKAYMHNGVFTTLEEVVNFYNTRDTGDWAAPEVPVNVNMSELGNLGLTPEDEAAIVAFLKTLSDGYQP